ncbi:MAG: hypothetical protein KDD92_03705 [Caldilineaceae bacterium]|nr:hypothetical protein [Caldilineaceae bacterium]
MLPEIVKGEWQKVAEMTDYRSERFSDMAVERATWTDLVSVQDEEPPVKPVRPGYIWFRFWLLEQQQIIEKYFDDELEPWGIYAPVTLPFHKSEENIAAFDLSLGLWVMEDSRILVVNEAGFDEAVAAGVIDNEAADYAEQRIRALTTAIGQNLFPPAMVRNFSLRTQPDDDQ